MTLNDLWPIFKGHAIIWRWMSQKRYWIQTQLQWNYIDLHTSYSTVSFRMTLCDLGWFSAYSMTRNIERSVNDSCATCTVYPRRGWKSFFGHNTAADCQIFENWSTYAKVIIKHQVVDFLRHSIFVGLTVTNAYLSDKGLNGPAALLRVSRCFSPVTNFTAREL